MEILGERPAWSMSDSEKLSTLDAVLAEQARLATYRLHLIADLERSGYAKELGAGDTARLLSQRYRIDTAEARRDVRVATSLDRHPATNAALPDPRTPFANPATAQPTTPGNPDDANNADAAAGPLGSLDTEDAETLNSPAANGAGLGGLDAAGSGLRGGWRVHPAHAEAIMSVLDKVPATVSTENLEFAERQLIDLAATHTPSELRRAGRKIRDILDPDGPEPDEQKAYDRESLTLKTADRGLTFRGYLANENAELFRTLIHAHAKPHKTIDGELDPRPRDKRQADALTTILTTAANPTPTPNTAAGKAGDGRAADNAVGTLLGTIEPRPTAATTAPSRGGHEGHREPEAHRERPGQRADDGERARDADDVYDGEEARDSLRDGQAVGHEKGHGYVAGYGPKAQISVTIDFESLKAATANATGALVFGDDLSAAVVRRLACDAEILPIVLGSKSQPLDVGTSQRLVTRPMRRALNARDKGCVVCGAPPIKCDAHHVVSWLDGGITAVSNLVLLCRRHHNDLHSGHWRIRIVDGVVQVTRPTWTNPTPIPQGRYRPPTTPIPSYLAPTSPKSPPVDARPSSAHPDSVHPVAECTGSVHPVDVRGDERQGSARPVGVGPGDMRPTAHFDPWGETDATDIAPQTGPRQATSPTPWPRPSSAPTGQPPGGHFPRPSAPTKPFDPWGEPLPDGTPTTNNTDPAATASA
ncbi:DUF222 domain-containing protein [Kribbella sp. CA-247076]|uniref:HNH endonuclease signature motif containing protein n=1 Tax=Kribbella sp. CA-247076 TaxID=3239941 RepID=UPI003D8E2655